MKKLLLIFSIFFTLQLFSQNTTVTKNILTRQFSADTNDFTVDNLGNIYLITTSGQVKKLNNKGDSISVYNEVRRFGKLYSIDVSNPFKILLYYKDFSTIIILDRLLNIVNTVDLKKLNYFQVSVIATSYDNNIWIYDEADSRLKKINDNGNILLQSSDYRQALETLSSPVSIFDRDGQLYLYDTLHGLFVFDYYGALKNNFQIYHLKDLQVFNRNTITARNRTDFILFKPATLQTVTLQPFIPEQYIKILFNPELVYCLTATGKLEIYTIRI